MGRDKKIVLTSSLIYLSGIAFLRSSYLYTTIVDDAYIFFRSAENILNGSGIVWNPGESPVEGYSSFLYLILLLFGSLISLDLEIFSVIIGIVCSSLHLYISYLIYQHFFPSRKKENIFTVIMIGLSPAFLYWSSAGMDTALYSMILLLSIYYFITLPNSDKLLLLKGVIFGFLCLVRFEAVLFFLLAAIYLIYQKGSKIKFKIGKYSILFCVGFLIIFTPYFLFRWDYFGYFLPNTFYAKTGGGIEQFVGGFYYSIRSFRLFYGLFWIAIGIILFNFRLRMLPGNARFIFSLSIISILTTIFLGGDHFSYGRFFIPVLPLLFITFPPALNKFLSLNVFAKFKSNHKLTFLLAIFISIILFKLPYIHAVNGINNLVTGKKDIVIVHDSNMDEDIVEWQHGYAMMGNAINMIAHNNDCIAAIPIGIIGYRSKIKVIDMVGIVDPVIAHQEFDPEYLDQWIPGHNKGDGKYILSQKPKYIQLIDYLTKFPKKFPDRRSLQFKSIKEIWSSEDFHINYEYYPIKVVKGWYYNLYQRK
jgi:hypothetical protein